MATAKIHTRKRANGKEFYQVQVRGKGLAKPYSASFDFLDEAQEWADEQNRKLAGEVDSVDVAPVNVLTVASLADEYLAFVHVDPKTGKLKKGHKDLSYKLWAIAKRLDGVAIDDINEALLTQYKLDGFKRVKACSVRKDLEVLARFLKWSNKTKGTTAEVEAITQEFLPVEAKRRERVITEKEYHQICAWAWNHKSWLEPIVMLGWETAMRRSEILSLRPSWIDFKKKVINLPEEVCKNGESREVPLSQIAVTLLESLVEGKQPNTPIFYVQEGTVSHGFRVACERLNIKGAVFHSLRHTAISRYAKKPGMNAMLLSTISGHKDLAMLQNYFHNDAEFVSGLMD